MQAQVSGTNIAGKMFVCRNKVWRKALNRLMNLAEPTMKVVSLWVGENF